MINSLFNFFLQEKRDDLDFWRKYWQDKIKIYNNTGKTDWDSFSSKRYYTFLFEDLREILDLINKSNIEKKPDELMENHIAQIAPKAPIDDRSKEEVKADDTDLYNISNFSV